MRSADSGRMNRFPAAMMLLLILVSVPSSAQPYPGDLLIGDHSSVGIVDRSLGTVRTLASTSTALYSALNLASDNATVLALLATGFPQQHFVLALSPVTGKQATLVTLPSFSNLGPMRGNCPDQDGSHVMGGWYTLLRVSGSGTTTLAQLLGLGGMAAVAIDTDTRDYMVDMSSQTPPMNTLLRIDRRTQAVTTVLSVNTGHKSEALEHDQKTGHFWLPVGWSGKLTRIVLLHRTTLGIIHSFPAPGAQGIAVDQPTSDLYVAAGSSITSYTPKGIALRSWGPFPGFQGIADIRVLGHRKLAGAGTAKPGGRYWIQLCFPESPGAAYHVAASFSGLRPGIPIGNRTIHIHPDPLFFLTAGRSLPGVTTGFGGILDPAGRALASLWIPATVSPGTVVTVAAVAVNPAKPASLDLGASITFMVL